MPDGYEMTARFRPMQAESMPTVTIDGQPLKGVHSVEVVNPTEKEHLDLGSSWQVPSAMRKTLLVALRVPMDTYVMERREIQVVSVKQQATRDRMVAAVESALAPNGGAFTRRAEAERVADAILAEQEDPTDV